jgi:hypothetical protein
MANLFLNKAKMAPANAGAKGKPRLLQQPGFLLPASIEDANKKLG